MVRIDKKTLQDLEFPTVLQQVSEFCITEPGTATVLAIEPFSDSNEIAPELQRVKEFSASFDNDNRIPNHGFDDISRELHLLNIENSLLEISSFRRLNSLCNTTGDLLAFFRKYKEFYKGLHEFSSEVIYNKEISVAINAVIDRYGEVKNTASQELNAIRKRLNVVKGQINASFSRALSRYSKSELLDEIRETVVDNRRVLAVKAMHRKKVRGTVLGQSRTGSIVYIEPQETLEFANELSNLLYEEGEEIKRILKELTDFIRPFRSSLSSYRDYLSYIDALYAKAKYAGEIGGNLPVLTKERHLYLKDAYHPLLLVSNKKLKNKTYPQTIELDPEKRIIVISGPNAGGKSITLKTVGLVQLMLQAGMLVPIDPMSECCVFGRILTDIGDNQSIENHLSTYSYRLKKMNQFLKKCNKDTLFLIDEFGTGSDPELGGALAETFLEVFYEREAFGIITTHYTNLKLLANELPHAVNANMQFDSRSLEPMFKLHLGEAGSSFTFEVAQKNGIPYSLINRAKKKIESGKVRFDKTIANLQKERSKVRKTAASLETTEKKAREETQQLQEINEKLQQKLESYQELFDNNVKMLTLGKKVDALAERYFNNKKKRELIDELVKLVMIENSKRKKIHPKKKRAVKAETKKLEQEVEKKVKVIRQKKKKEKEEVKKAPPPKPKVALKIGDRVRMIDGRAIGTIDSIEKNNAIVNYGMFTADVSMDELEKV